MPNNTYVIGLDLGGTNIRGAAVDRSGKLWGFRKFPTEVQKGKTRVIRNLANLIREIQQRYPNKRLVGVGAGVPGTIQFEKGIVTRSPHFPDWKNVHLRKELALYLDVPFMVDNDANMAAIGERWKGAGKQKTNFCMITLGTGIGGGIFLNNRIFRGDHGMAGEIGHMTVHPDGYPCGCGNTGCWELYASANGLIRLAEELKTNSNINISRKGKTKRVRSPLISPDGLGKLADRGDPFAISVFKQYGRYLGIGIANLANVLNIDTFVIGGGVLGSWRHFADSARREIRRRAYVFIGKKVDLRKALCGDSAGILGAALTVYDNI